MTEYIEREAAICIAEYAEDEHPYKVPQVPETYSDYNQGWCDACVYIREKLEGSEAADVEPVRHGRWYWDCDGYCRCSECKQKTPSYEHDNALEAVLTMFCPKCGAKMDSERQ